MARLTTIGYEVGFPGASVISPDTPGAGTVTAGVSRDTTNQRSGLACAKFDSGANAAANTPLRGTPSASLTTYLRAYLNFAQFPASSISVLGWTATGITARVSSAGKLQLWNDSGTPVQIGSDSAVTMVTGTYYRVELSAAVNGSLQITDAVLRLDGVTVATATGLTVSVSKATVLLGWIAAPGASKVFYADDVAINDSTGTVNNSWPGSGKVILLTPISDQSVGTGWTLGTGTAISGNAGATAIKNTPPLGVADLAAGSDVKQIRNANAAGNTIYWGRTGTYTAAGVGASDTVNAVHSWVCTAAPVATAAKAGSFGLANNPTVADVALGAGGTAGAFWSGTAAGTYPTGWKWSPGTITEAPTVTLGTGALVEVQQVTAASTRIAMVCFAGVYVDYTPSVAPAPKSLVAGGNRDLRSRAVPHLMVR